MKLSWRNPFFILGLVLLWRIALLIFTAQPIPANDAFIFDGGIANWLKHGQYVNPCIEVGYPISGGQVFSIYPPVYQAALLVWMPMFGASALSMMAMHLAIYRARPDIHAVVHAHPPVSTGFAVAGRALNLGLMPELIVSMGSVPLAEYGLPGTPALVEGMLPYIPKYDAMLMGNHGCVSYGEDVYKAFFKMETVEHFARIALVAELLGGPKVLPKEEVDKLFDSRTRYGVKSRANIEPGCPVVAEDMETKQERFQVTREELIALVDEALRARGVLA